MFALTHLWVLADTPFVPIPRLARSIARKHGGGSQLADLESRLPAPLPRVHVVDPADFLHARHLAGWTDLVGVEEVDVAGVVVRFGFVVAVVAAAGVEAEHAGGDDDDDGGGYDHDADDQGWRDGGAEGIVVC